MPQKFMKNLRKASLGSNFTRSYKKEYNLYYNKHLVPKFMNISEHLYHEYFSVMVSGNDCKCFLKVSKLFPHIMQKVLLVLHLVLLLL